MPPPIGNLPPPPGMIFPPGMPPVAGAPGSLATEEIWVENTTPEGKVLDFVCVFSTTKQTSYSRVLRYN